VFRGVNSIQEGSLCRTGRGCWVQLSKCLNQGGEGRIHEVRGYDAVLAKVYVAPCSLAQALKLRSLLSLPKPESGANFAWPFELLFKESGECCGFLMPRAAGTPLVSLHSLALLRQRVPSAEDPLMLRLFLLRVVHSMASGFAALERMDLLPVDVSAMNILVCPESGVANFVDCDGFQVPATATPGLVCVPGGSTPEYLPPELLDPKGTGAVGRRTQTHLRFSAAVLFFETLMLGWHPYQCVGAESPVENLLAGRTALGSSLGLARGIYPKDVFALYRAGMSPGIKHLFIRTLVQGHRNPEVRADFASWQKTLLRSAREVEGLIHARRPSNRKQTNVQ